MKILVIHGPNMPLIGRISADTGNRLTLDKIDKALRKEANSLNVELKIYQFYDEAHIIKAVRANRNSCDGLLINPGPLALTCHSLKELLSIVQMPAVEICVKDLPFSNESFSKSVLKEIVASRVYDFGKEVYAKGLNILCGHLG